MEKCGCRATKMDLQGNIIEIKRCPLHAAAGEMLETLENVELTLREDVKRDATLSGCLMVIQYAILKAKGE